MVLTSRPHSLLSSCNFDHILIFTLHYLPSPLVIQHYKFRPNWPSSGVYVVSLKDSDDLLSGCSVFHFDVNFIVGECILLQMYQISKYRQPSFATVLQRGLLYTYITTCFG
jgi:hypothetical protein